MLVRVALQLLRRAPLCFQDIRRHVSRRLHSNSTGLTSRVQEIPSFSSHPGIPPLFPINFQLDTFKPPRFRKGASREFEGVNKYGKLLPQTRPESPGLDAGVDLVSGGEALTGNVSGALVFHSTRVQLKVLFEARKTEPQPASFWNGFRASPVLRTRSLGIRPRQGLPAWEVRGRFDQGNAGCVAAFLVEHGPTW